METRTSTPPPATFHGTARYQALRLIGQGGMGAVYQVLDRDTGAQRALKVMLKQTPRALLGFKREFRSVADLVHPNLVRLFELARADDRWFFTMELIDGSDLRGYFDLGCPAAETLTVTDVGDVAMASATRPPGPACDPRAVRGIALQITHGLEALHSVGLVHGDLKPGNVLVGVDGRVRLADFGLAACLEAPDRPRPDRGGTLGYMAPELWLGQARAPATDAYALGCLLFQLLTGAPPFERPEAAAQEGARVPRVDERVVGAPPDLTELCIELMARTPADRPDMGSARARLRAALGPPDGTEEDVEVTAVLEPGAIRLRGRRAEIERCAAALQSAQEGRVQLVSITGESGIGKTTLMERIGVLAEQRGFRVLRGRSHEREKVPFGALDRVIDELVAHWMSGPIDARRRDLARALLPVFPVMSVVESASAPIPTASEWTRSEAFEAFRQLLQREQSDAPVLLALDDLHWIDADTVELFRQVLPRLKGRLLLLLGSRPATPDMPCSVRPILAAAEHHMPVTELPLGPLTSSDAAHLVTALGTELRSDILRRAGGNPFVLTLFAEAARADAAASVESLVAERVRGLTRDARELLWLSVVAGVHVERAFLRRGAGLTGVEFDMALGELASHRLAQSFPGDRIGAYHDWIRTTVYDGLAPDHRKALHGRLGAVLEAAEGHRWGGPEALLHHWREAGDGPRTRAYLEQAAEAAATNLAFVRAGTLYAELATLDIGRPAARAAEQAAHHFHMAGEWDTALPLYRAALEFWDGEPASPAHDTARVRLLGAMGEVQFRRGEVQAAIDAFAAGSRALGVSPRGGPLGSFARAGVLVLVDGVRRRAGRRSRGASDVAQTAQDFWERMAWGTFPFLPARSIEAMVRAARLARLRGDVRGVARMDTLLEFARAAARPGGVRPTERWRDVASAPTQPASLRAVPPDAPFVQLGRALAEGRRHDGTDLVQRLTAAVHSIEERGADETLEGSLARMARVLIAVVNGELEVAADFAAGELARERSDYVCGIWARRVLLDVACARADPDAAHQAAADLQSYVRPEPLSWNHMPVVTVDAVIAHVEGDYRAAIRSFDRAVRHLTLRLGPAPPMVDGMFSRLRLWSYLGLAQQGRLGVLERRRSVHLARRSIRMHAHGAACTGYRALALLEHLEGHAAAARSALEAALLTSLRVGAFLRWQCLEAARALGAANEAMLAEADGIAETLGLLAVHPHLLRGGSR